MGNTRRNAARARRSGVRTIIATMCAVAMAAIGLVSAAPVAALSGSQFSPGNIIADSEFYKVSMSEVEIQAFLDAQIGTCQNGSTRCLNVLVHTMPSKPRTVSSATGNVRCEAFQGGERLRASTIIYRAQVACGISAKVILVTLQKEQGLISSRPPGKAALDRAMGMACPDTAACASYALGFGNQVFLGAQQLKTYKAANFAMQPGTRTIRWHPNASCGSSTFVVENYATAALYNYTPYRPNPAALNNLGGAGDACSSYGNRNFWVFYNNWFGSPILVGPPADIRPTAAVERVGGSDRYQVGASLAAQNFPTPGIPALYIATGADFPDALGAAAAAAKAGGPLLLVTRTGIPQSVRTQIIRLKPAQIVVAGGPGSVSDGVVTELATLAPSIRRDTGVDRYEASRTIARAAFPSATTAFLATGATFPDALSASAAAGSVDAPVILVRGTDQALDAPTLQLLRDLGVANIVIAGGPASVSAGIEANLKTAFGSAKVIRRDGTDRYAVSEAINKAAFAKADTVYLASGTTFPDALSGAAIAGGSNSPLLVVHRTCLVKSVAQQIVDLGAKKVVVLGGTGTLDSAIDQYANCK